MFEGVGTLGTNPPPPFAPVWALSAWEGPPGPGVLARAWGSTRRAMLDLVEPLIQRLGVSQIIEALDASAALDRSLLPYARSTYDRTDLEAIVVDPGVAESYDRLGRAMLIVARDFPHWVGRPRATNLFPRRVLFDSAVRARVAQGLEHVRDIAIALRTVTLASDTIDASAEPAFETPLEERAGNPCWWAYDAAFPVAIAERLLAGRRAGIIPALVRISRRTWAGDSMRRAVLDWADDLASYAGLFASLPGVEMPSVPPERRLDLVAVVEHHRQVMAAREQGFARVHGELRDN